MSNFSSVLHRGHEAMAKEQLFLRQRRVLPCASLDSRVGRSEEVILEPVFSAIMNQSLHQLLVKSSGSVPSPIRSGFLHEFLPKNSMQIQED